MIAVMSGNYARTVIGLVHQDSKVAAGRNGARATFWTAWIVVEGRRLGPSLGTRHKTKTSAMRAVRAFWEWRFMQPTTSTSTNHYLIDKFKYAHPQICALPYKPVAENAVV